MSRAFAATLAVFSGTFSIFHSGCGDGGGASSKGPKTCKFELKNFSLQMKVSPLLHFKIHSF
jgi:hypothetical protein